MKWKNTDWLSVLALAGLVAVTGWLYWALPDPVPTHWNSEGIADGFTPKPWGAWMYSLIVAATIVLAQVAPAISPRGFRMEKFFDVYVILRNAIVLVLAAIFVAAHLAAAGFDINLGIIITTLIGAMLAIVGNFVGKVRRNFFVGIKTPWTLADPEVWDRTHRVAGRALTAGGLAMMILALAGVGMGVILALVLVVALFPIPYSYFLYRRLLGFEQDVDDTE